MQNKLIKISVNSIDDGDDTIQFEIEMSNGINSTSQIIYGNADCFKEFADKLLSFPKTIFDKVEYEYGNNGEHCACYILLEVFCYENNGYSAMHVIANDNAIQPYTNKCEFYIRTLPASINSFGRLLNDWNPITDKEIIWIAE